MPLDNMPDSDPFNKHNTNSPIMFPVGERKLKWEGTDGTHYRVNSHKALVRAIDGKPFVLNVVGSNYRLVHNKELFRHVEDTMRKEIPGHALHDVRVTDSVSGFGRMCFRQYVFPNIKCRLRGNVKADIAFRLLVQNGYGGSALRVHAGAIDFYCTNGMISGEYESIYRKHTKGVEVANFSKTVQSSLASFHDKQHTWQRWAETPVKHSAAMALFRELANSDKLREKLTEQYVRETEARGNNLWSLYSALTYYASHSDGEFKPRKTVEEQDSLASVMLKRELNIAQWVETRQWKALELV